MLGLLERHARHGTAHASLIGEILSVLAGTAPAPPSGPQPPLEPLSDSEIRVLRYLPTNTISTGKYADLAVLSADYFNVDDGDISRIKSVPTIVGWKIVWSSTEFGRMAAPLPMALPADTRLLTRWLPQSRA